MYDLQKPVQYVKGVGEKKAQALARLGIYTLNDALFCYPRDYENRSKIVSISELIDGEKAAIIATIATKPTVTRIKNGIQLTKLTVYDESATLKITYFNNKYIASNLLEGKEYLFYGKAQVEGAFRSMTSPAYERVNGDFKPRIMPVYPLSAGLFQRDILNVTRYALECQMPDDPIPNDILERYSLPKLCDALESIHRPRNEDDIAKARQRIVFEELFLLCCGLGLLKQHRGKERGIVFENTDLSAFWKILGFPPTNAQLKAVNDCCTDVKSTKRMNRLVQGDVGSGKTVVAAALCMLAAQNGYQAAVMAPTEILASQHYKSLSVLFEKLGVNTVLLTGSMGAKEKREALTKIEDGSANVLIGTHALIQKNVKFLKLGAVIVDEQHRFGVSQRASLQEKGEIPHTLVMSATPIPRTLALMIYGDLDVSIIDELPPGRTPVKTYAVGEKLRGRINKFIEKQVLLGGQVYVVCPLVEEGETELKSAEEHGMELEKIFPKFTVGVLHGRMKPSEKDDIMQRFSAGKIDILVSTTVIEVGVNVPNANLMIVEDAQRFGLSQLHQLRGRVGRGKRESYCIFFGADKGEAARQRLSVLTSSNNGFEVAQADLAQRGPGDFFGCRQHGLPPLKNLAMLTDLNIMEYARNEAQRLISENPELSNYPALKNRTNRMFEIAGNDIFN